MVRAKFWDDGGDADVSSYLFRIELNHFAGCDF